MNDDQGDERVGDEVQEDEDNEEEEQDEEEEVDLDGMTVGVPPPQQQQQHTFDPVMTQQNFDGTDYQRQYRSTRKRETKMRQSD